MNKVKKFLAVLLVGTMLTIPVLAASDSIYWVSNITIKPWQAWNLMDINADSYGAYVFMQLDVTGEVVDKIEFVAISPNGNEISNHGVATEGASSSTRINYNDGNNTSGRWLTGLNVKSYNQNYAGEYSINGKVIY